MLLSADLQNRKKLRVGETKELTDNTYAAGTGVAFDTVVRLIYRAYSLTLAFASTMDVAAGTTVDLQRVMVDAADFGVLGTILEVANAMAAFFLSR